MARERCEVGLGLGENTILGGYRTLIPSTEYIEHRIAAGFVINRVSEYQKIVNKELKNFN